MFLPHISIIKNKMLRLSLVIIWTDDSKNLLLAEYAYEVKKLTTCFYYYKNMNIMNISLFHTTKIITERMD